ncbi:hypothetical protein [Micromonospora zamorensis]|uniref:Uncharacterized protein n=2 Tax=Micromonospora zamorensis TaxID=709883 RepID=A0ABZ1PES1_9ACTN
MKAQFADGKYTVTMDRNELVVIISALVMLDEVVPSDAALRDYVGRTREDFRRLTDELAEVCRPEPYRPEDDRLAGH